MGRYAKIIFFTSITLFLPKNRLKQNVREAMSLYEKAAKLVEESFFTLDMAVIYELTARFYSETGFFTAMRRPHG